MKADARPAPGLRVLIIDRQEETAASLAIDGPRFVQAIRQRCPAPPLLVAMSGFALPHDAQRARRAGFDHHFDAPPKPDELGRLLDGVRQRSV